MINIEFVQLNIACISEDTGIKVYKSDGSPAKFKPTALTQWCFLDGKTSILCTRKRDSHFLLNKEFVVSCVSLRPSLKSTLTRRLFLYSPTPGGHLCSAYFTIPLVYLWYYPKGKLMTRGKWNYVYGASFTLNIGIQQDFPCLELFLVSSLDKRALFSLGLEYRFLPLIRFNITVNYVGQVPVQEAFKLHDPQYRRERLLVSFTQPLTGTSIIFLKLNILSLAKKELR